MDVTPSNKMFQAMSNMTDAVCGEAPLVVESGAAASQRRENRKKMMDFLHRLVHLAMREGAARAMNPDRACFGRIIQPPMNIGGPRG
jgi:hypothetical protein